MDEESLRDTMFPIGSLQKPSVKMLAAQMGLERIARKQESMGICFIGKRSFASFMREYLDDAPGDVLDVETHTRIGTHRGVHYYTLGQRISLHYFPKGTTKYAACRMLLRL